MAYVPPRNRAQGLLALRNLLQMLPMIARSGGNIGIPPMPPGHGLIGRPVKGLPQNDGVIGRPIKRPDDWIGIPTPVPGPGLPVAPAPIVPPVTGRPVYWRDKDGLDRTGPIRSRTGARLPIQPFMR